MRMLQQRRMIKATLKALMKYLAKQDLTKEDKKDGNELREENVRIKEEIEKSLQESYNPALIDKASTLPCKLTLAPLEHEGAIRLPAPHLSHTKLPAIKRDNKKEEML